MKREDLYMRSFRGEDGFNEFVQSLGGNPAAITKAAGLVPHLPKGLINFESFAGTCRLFEEGAKQTNEPQFGLKWALNQPPDFRFSGPNVLLLSMSSNAGQWLDMAIDYQKIHSNGMSFRYEKDTETDLVTGYIYVHPLAPPCRQMVEQFVACIAIIGRQFIPSFNFHHLAFQHGPPEDMSLYDEVFQCPIVFNADQVTITTGLQYLKMKKTGVVTKLVLPLVRKYMNWQLDKHPRGADSISMLITESLPGIMGVRGSSVNDIAQVLDIHPKKIQRLLKDEGTNFSDVLDDVRKNIAERLLIESDISIARLAGMLDYSSDRPFTAASKRWFGMTPTEFRRARREESGEGAK